MFKFTVKCIHKSVNCNKTCNLIMKMNEKSASISVSRSLLVQRSKCSGKNFFSTLFFTNILLYILHGKKMRQNVDSVVQSDQNTIHSFHTLCLPSVSRFLAFSFLSCCFSLFFQMGENTKRKLSTQKQPHTLIHSQNETRSIRRDRYVKQKKREVSETHEFSSVTSIESIKYPKRKLNQLKN